MDWKKEAMEKLRDLEVKKQALHSIPQERERIQCVMEGIRSAGVDGDPVKGSTTRREDRLLSCIVKLQELDRSEKQARLWVGAVSAALAKLDGDERLVLDRLYVCPVKNGISSLCQEMALEQSSVYRHRDRALRNFTLALYGGLES